MQSLKPLTSLSSTEENLIKMCHGCKGSIKSFRPKTAFTFMLFYFYQDI